MKSGVKIKAFTLTEISVVIVISAIVAGLAFSVLNIVQRNMQTIGANYEYQEQIQGLEVALTIDFNDFTSVKWNPVENQLIMSSPINQRVYLFTNDSISTEINTFDVRIKEKVFYFEGKSVNSGDIDAVKLIFDNTREAHRVFVSKHNDPTIHF
ncbi:PulJ/GspJ family protein [Aquimarina pacifica]|uniref:PulJ/GspJ family protein n=1 Tax=Aquimarina pacifica TaxID=1296415 RepID=UPI00046F7397|nr:type II secretion system protein [Aquimarina pacifica]